MIERGKLLRKPASFKSIVVGGQLKLYRSKYVKYVYLSCYKCKYNIFTSYIFQINYYFKSITIDYLEQKAPY